MLPNNEASHHQVDLNGDQWPPGSERQENGPWWPLQETQELVEVSRKQIKS